MTSERTRQVQQLYRAVVGRLIDSIFGHGRSAAGEPSDHSGSKGAVDVTADDSTVTITNPDAHLGFAPGTILAQRYRIVHLLGRGGMGEVYRADDLLLGQPVALKFLPAATTASASALSRFRNEVRTARQVSHPNVCRVYDIGEVEGLTYLSMEYVDGEDLASLLRRIGRIPQDKALEIARKLCAGLAAAHDKGVVHRDLKPANIMLDSKGQVRITDFGLAGVSDHIRDVRSGTPAYMSPEQLSGKEVTLRSDIYALGIVLHELFTGQRTILNYSGTELDPAVGRVIRRCLDLDPKLRPASALAVAAALPGGDPLAAALAAGETPSPELVADAGATEGLSVRVAILCLSAAIAALIIFAFVAPQVSIVSRLPIETPDALERVARDTLSKLEIHETIRHRVARFGYDIDALRRHFDPAALYFWYRTSPYWMIPRSLTAIVTPADPPGELPGMITTKWDGTGRLLYLNAVPPPGGTAAVTTPELWTRVFTAAGLQLTQFKPADSGWIPAPGWDARGTWTGTYPDRSRTPVRVEAATWHGRLIYFEVVLASRNGVGEPPRITIERLIAVQLGAYIVVFLASAALAWRNVDRGRGDRRGAFRIAVFVFVAGFLTWACRASHVPDVTEFTLLFLTLLLLGFNAVLFWTVYMAFEPYVRRRWPHAIISWSRILSGRFRDPLVGGHILIGVTFGAVIVVLITSGLWLAGLYGLRLPSFWMLSGATGVFAHALENVLAAVTHGLALLFFTFFSKVFFRTEWLAVVVIVPFAFVFEAPWPLAPAAVILIIVPFISALVYLLLRGGLLSATVAIYTFYVLIALPLTADLSAPATGASILMLCIVAVLALFGFHSTLAWKSLFKLDL
jgi:hypothetical protein